MDPKLILYHFWNKVSWFYSSNIPSWRAAKKYSWQRERLASSLMETFSLTRLSTNLFVKITFAIVIKFFSAYLQFYKAQRNRFPMKLVHYLLYYYLFIEFRFIENSFVSLCYFGNFFSVFSCSFFFVHCVCIKEKRDCNF